MLQILTTIGNMAEFYSDRDIVVRKLPRGRRSVLLRDLIRLSPQYDAAVLFGAVGFRSGYVDLLAAGVVGRRRTPVVLTECYWETSSRAMSHMFRKRKPSYHDATPSSSGLLAQRAIRLLDSERVHYCVLSSAEAARFPGAWGIPASRVHFTPFCYGISADRDEPGVATTIFAGGDSLRDYRALVAVAQTLPAPVVIATRLAEPLTQGNLRLGPLPPQIYDTELRSARVVVVPLRADTLRSAGQQTYLSAMALGKPLVVTDSPGVRDYVRDRETGIIVRPNDPQQMSEAIRWVLDDENQQDVQRMTERARATALESYSLDAYLRRVLDVVAKAVPTG
jgi:hypothetical protein